jgi:hypothetical protein
VPALVLNWEAQQAHCPQGHTSVHWRPGRDVSGDPVIRIRFDGSTCRACPARPAAPRRKALHANSRSAPSSTMRPSRPPNGRRPPVSPVCLRAGVEVPLTRHGAGCQVATPG